MVAAAVYPVDPTTSQPADIVLRLPASGWEFWIHRVAVDPLTKGIGATPLIFLIVLLVMREFLEIIRTKATTIETILKTEGAQEAHDGFWGWETSYKDDIPVNK